MSVVAIERVHDPSRIAPELGEVYRSAFSVFPDGPDDAEVARFVDETLPRHAGRTDFRLFVARCDGAIAGFIYGYHGERGQYWEDWIHGLVPEAVYNAWFGEQYNLTEFCVAAGHQGRGIGRRLYETLLSELRYDSVVLTTRRVDTPARRFYLKQGWEVVCDALDEKFSLLGLRGLGE